MTDTSQGQDGAAHLTYYDKTHIISFIWDGTKGDLVDVCPGGYAEPAVGLFRLSFDPTLVNTHAALAMFEADCETFVERIFAYTDPRLP